MKITVLHTTGNSNVRAILRALVQANMLAEFDTTIGISSAATWLRLMPGQIRNECLRRSFAVPPEQLWVHPIRELAHMILPRIGLKRFVRHEQGWASWDAVHRSFDAAAAKRLKQQAKKSQVGAVYAYEDAALATFTQAKALGLKCIYDLPIAYWETGRALMMEEAERQPEWACTLGGGIHDSPAKLERKEKELKLADVVIGPGQFVIDSVPEWARGKKLISAPFGSPTSSAGLARIAETDAQTSRRPLRVLFVGGMSQRKGLGDLLDAVRLLNRSDLELVVMGIPMTMVPMEFYKNQFSQAPNVRYEPSRSHGQVLEFMRTCDVFCLPSIVEGRALVMQEAMSQGLPLIITPNTGGSDLIQEGATGFLVPIRSPEAIAEKIEWFLDNRSAIPEMGRLAQQHAARYTWESYSNHIVRSLAEYLAV